MATLTREYATGKPDMAAEHRTHIFLGIFRSRAFRKFRRSPTANAGVIITSLVAFAAIFGPLLIPHDPYEQDLMLRLQRPSLEHWMGTDQLGRDLLSRIVLGARITLLVSLGAIMLAALVGMLLGAFAALTSGFVDTLVMRTMDVLLALPGVLLAIAVVAALGPSLINVMIAIAVSAVPEFARLANGSTLSVREEDFVLAAYASGANDRRLLLYHVLPNIVSPIFVQFSLRVATTVLTVAGLSFLGLGAQPPTPEWGRMLSEAQTYLRAAPYVAVFPGVVILITVMGINMLGDGLRDAFDPRSKD